MKEINPEDHRKKKREQGPIEESAEPQKYGDAVAFMSMMSDVAGFDLTGLEGT